MNITPIKTAKDYRNALKRIEQLMAAKKGSKEGDELDVLVTLVDSYEAAHYPIDNPDPIFAIEARLEALGLERKDLEKAIGSRGRVSEVLNKKRKLTLDMIRELTELLEIPAKTLIQDYRIRA